MRFTVSFRVLAPAVAAGLLVSGAQAGAGGRHCSATAWNQYVACSKEVVDDLFEARAKCINVIDGSERGECFADAYAEKKEGRELCRDQFMARRELCGELGEARYDPGFDPADFLSGFDPPATENPYFPLTVGDRWVYVGGDETITVEVLDETKQIEDVTCIVVNDVVEEDGELIEDTDDWYGVRNDGTVGYFGEIAENFETFAGDDPELPELVDIEGSFKAGRDGAKAGTRLPGAPAVGDVYREEWAAGDAEDAARVIATDYDYGDDPELDAFVPQALAELLCDGDCLVTENFTPLEPDVLELKYYAPGVGTFLEINLEDGEVVQLVECNVDPKCASLPTP